MTPRDFLDSVTQMQPIGRSFFLNVHFQFWACLRFLARQKRRDLTDDEVRKILKKTPPFNKGSKDLFRHLNDGGLISYTEYLFLLCVLTSKQPFSPFLVNKNIEKCVSEPASGFRIAFNMFDTDGNQKVDKKEFLVVSRI